MKIGIIGAGWIADKMAETLTGLDSTMKYAIAARDLGRAREFARRWNFQKAYGSYKELVEDPEVELVYVATPTILNIAVWLSTPVNPYSVKRLLPPMPVRPMPCSIWHIKRVFSLPRLSGPAICRSPLK